MTHRPHPPHSDRGHIVITDELVRLCLGGRPERPELEAPLVDYNNARTPQDRRPRRRTR